MAVSASPSPPVRLALPDPAATADLARRLARIARPGDVIGLGGALGAGKTLFARACINRIAELSGVAAVEVPSPTFTLMQEYVFPGATVSHFDLYRIERPEDTWELGIEAAFAAGISLIELPERLGPLLPHLRLDVVLSQGAAPEARVAEIAGTGDWPARLRGVLPDE